MTIPSNSSLITDRGAPAKDVLITTSAPAPLTPATGFALRLGASLDLAKQQTIVGLIGMLERFAAARLHETFTTVGLDIDVGVPQLDLAHATNNITFLFGTAQRGAGNSLDFSTSVNTLVNVFLEQTKDT